MKGESSGLRMGIGGIQIYHFTAIYFFLFISWCQKTNAIMDQKYHRRQSSLDNWKSFDEILFNSLTAFCSGFDRYSGKEDGQVSSSAQSSYYLFTPKPNNDELFVVHGPKKTTFASKWSGPSVFPYQVTAERKENNNVILTFFVLHQAHAFISRDSPFDFDRVVLKYPQSTTTPIQTKVTSLVDYSACGSQYPDPKDVVIPFSFELGEKRSYSVTTLIDLCRIWRQINKTSVVNSTEKDKSEAIKSADREIENGLKTHEIPLPQFEVHDDPGDEIVVESGKNASLRVSFNLTMLAEITIKATVWDKFRNQMLVSRAVINLGDPFNTLSLEVMRFDSTESIDERDLLRVEISDRSSLARHPSAGKNLAAKLNIVVNTENNLRSGHLELGYVWRQPPISKWRPVIVNRMESKRKINIVFPTSTQPFPENTAYITTKQTFQCDRFGNRKHLTKESENCTITCEAIGSKIQAIFLMETNSSISIVRSAFYVQRERAFAALNLGPASPNLDGKYPCIVFTENGERLRKDLPLFTSRFTEIRDLTFRDFDNGTSQISCTSFGAQPVEMSVTGFDLYGKTQRIDGENATDLVETVSGDHKNLTFNLPTIDVALKTNLTCHGAGERGKGSKTLDLPSYLFDIGAVFPAVDSERNVTYITLHENNTVEISCSGTGFPPLKAMIQIGYGPKSSRVNNEKEVNKTRTENGRRLTVNLQMDANFITDYSIDVRCIVSNRFGSNQAHITVPNRLKDHLIRIWTSKRDRFFQQT